MSLPPQAARPETAKVMAGGYAIESRVLSGIQRASAATGVDFAYLMAQAAQESAFRSDARATTSSATGLYQFIESTWLAMVRDHGAKHGAGAHAAQIGSGPSGEPVLKDPAARGRILALRDDPRLNAALGAEYARDNKATIEAALGREASSTDLYLAHFLGAGGATQLLQAIERNGNRPAAELLPAAAAANTSVFYDPEGNPRSVRELHRMLSDKIERRSASFASLDPGSFSVIADIGNGAARSSFTGGAKLSVLSVLAMSAYELLAEGEKLPRRASIDA